MTEAPRSRSSETGRGLDLALSLSVILQAARARQYLSFGDIAFASGIPWPQARRAMGRHLKAVCGLSVNQGGPLVSSIVVNACHVRTGTMNPETLAGFLASARELGFAFTDGEAFLRGEQVKTFRFAAAGVVPTTAERTSAATTESGQNPR